MIEDKKNIIVLDAIEKVEQIIDNAKYDLINQILKIKNNLSYKNTLEKIKVQQLIIELKKFLDYYYKQQKQFDYFQKLLFKFWENPKTYISNINFYNVLSSDLEVAKLYIKKVHELFGKNDLKKELETLKDYENILCITAK